MKLSYFSYDFWECCCEAVNAGVACGPTGVPGVACCVRPGCCVCPWAAARPLAVRAASFARRVVSKPGQAPPPPTGTAARPSGPSGALHTSGAGSLFGSSTRRLEARPGPYWDPVPRPQPSRPALTSHISEPTRNFARNSPTSLSNSEIRSLELQRFQTLLKLLPIELHATFRGVDSQHPPTASPETDNTNAGESLPLSETTDTTASSSPHTFETADTFARTKQPICGHFPPAKVSRVSCAPRRGPAKASPVSSDVESGLLIRSKTLRRSCLLPPSHSW